MKVLYLTLEAFSTSQQQFKFYFPEPGRFSLNPANLGQNGRVVAAAAATSFEVLAHAPPRALEDINDIIQEGREEDILNFIATKNILNRNIFQFSKVYHLLKNREFFLKVLDVLRRRKVFDKVVWSFALLHDEMRALRELFAHLFSGKQAPGFCAFMQNELVATDRSEALEYYPLMNSRIHLLAENKVNITNFEFL